MDFTGNLKRYMRVFGLSNEDLAKEIGVNAYSVYSWVRGVRYPSTKNLCKLSYFFGTDPNELLSWDEYMEQMDVGRAKVSKESDIERRTLVTPRKIGEFVWDKDVKPWKVVSIEFRTSVVYLHCISPETCERKTFATGKQSVGKTVFYSKEEAEDAYWEG